MADAVEQYKQAMRDAIEFYAGKSEQEASNPDPSEPNEDHYQQAHAEAVDRYKQNTGEDYYPEPEPTITTKKESK